MLGTQLSRPSLAGASPRKGVTAGTGDKISNKAEQLKGKGKESVGKVTDDEQLEAEGRADQAKDNIKQAGEKVKDTVRD